ncbi:MAG: DNA polymerase/3'-5' exonuclease PolX [Planctomycetota bacterium]
MNNAEVALIFDGIANMLEIKGEDSFRVLSYRRVARTVGDLTTDINEVTTRGELAELPGVGKASAQKIQELLATGRLPLYEQLCAEVPQTLLELLEIPSVGPKKIHQLWKECGVTSVAELKACIAAKKLAGLKGFGEKTIQAIVRGIEFRESSAGRAKNGDALYIALGLLDGVRAMPGVQRAEYAGSLRRGRETVGDVDLLCATASAADGERIVRAFAKLPVVVEVLAAGGTKASVRVPLERGRTLQVDLRAVPAESFGAAWQYFTGSKEHNVRLRELAQKRGWTLNEYGLTEVTTKRVVAAASEEKIYAALGLPWIPPELREARGEFDEPIPADLLRLEDIRGDLHVHTVASDGRNTIAEMAAAAQACGYEYICITEHSPSSIIANGLKTEQLREHIRAVREAGRAAGLTVWVGTEVDILPGGRLDYPDELLAELDFVIASIHAGMTRDRATNTQRTLAAIENPYVNCIGHPTGRIINEREAMPLDMEAVARAAARTGTALEINASYHRLDLKDQHVRLARNVGATVCICTDAHSTGGYEEMHFGVTTGRRGWLRRSDVLNTRPAAEVAAFVAQKRRVAAAG